jgi:hypothetical protein
MLFKYLSNEEMKLVLSAISIPSLSKLAASFKAYYVIVHRHIYDRLTTNASPILQQCPGIHGSVGVNRNCHIWIAGIALHDATIQPQLGTCQYGYVYILERI